MKEIIKTYRELRVYQKAMDAAMELYEATKRFPPEEKYSMVDQVRRSSRSVCANIAESWRKRRYKAAFIAKLNDAESEACETQVWIEFAYKCGFIDKLFKDKMDDFYEHIMSQLVKMIDESTKWLIKSK
ncbi:MAG: four helix bundle protein [Proteobacteria bacterium]|nr:four helix bundle protein [Pseudomonadota bacterium]